ncbi:hypothetical protein EET67_12940 [Pseudaminobacter arsenicus]|uniref:Flagellar protein n=1 Tax=Borborobacter arsenicus TaxID=1851146 RepID=A0A432V5X0_9HYPH|nr:hypothetical protein [Pseudaminobacter arsenicus]RUM97551.1 hypothetical protein EET67_12940 [Pseudaminobacter arsenicus]
MQLSQIEQTLSDQLQAMKVKESGRWPKLGLPFRRRSAEAAARASSQTKDRRGDLVIAGLGVALGLGCALFPWFIFLNQEKFGIRALEFSGGGRAGRTAGLSLEHRADRSASEAAGEDLTIGALDPFPTGTLPDRRAFTPLADQPFPADPIEFRLVHIANGRAMIADDSGLWVVQRGSSLPDNSRVASIEQRGGKWVLVTSTDRVLELTQ